MVQSSAERFRALPRALRWCVFIVVAFGILLLRRPGALANAAFFYEDGQVFYVGAFFGDFLDQLFRQYEGYLHLAPRFVAALERLVPPPSAPLVGNAVSL